MATYQELKAQAEKLMAEAEEARQRELAEAIRDIKAKIQAFGLTAADLGIGGISGDARGRKAGSKTTPRQKAPGGKTPAVIKYRGPNGEPWGGGRGRKPQWVVQALASGKSLDQFAVKE